MDSNSRSPYAAQPGHSQPLPQGALEVVLIAEARAQPLDFGLGVDRTEFGARGEAADVGVEVMASGEEVVGQLQQIPGNCGSTLSGAAPYRTSPVAIVRRPKVCQLHLSRPDPMAASNTPQPSTADRPENSTTSVDANPLVSHVRLGRRISPSQRERYVHSSAREFSRPAPWIRREKGCDVSRDAALVDVIARQAAAERAAASRPGE